MAANPLLCSPDQKQTIEITNQANVVDYLAEFAKHGRPRITESVVFEIHRLTIENLYPCAGNYCTAPTRVEMTDTNHKPSHPSQVGIDVRNMLDWLDNGGRAESPIHRASFGFGKSMRSIPSTAGTAE